MTVPEAVVFSTDRLAVRPWRSGDAAHLLDIRSRPDVAKWLSDPEPWVDVGRALAEIERWAGLSADDPRLGVWAIVPRETGVPVGTVSLKHLPGSDEVEIGWSLHPDATGRGYAREAAAGALERAVRSGIARIWAVMWPHNEASARVAAAIGMSDLGVRADPWYGTPEDPDSRMFRLDVEP